MHGKVQPDVDPKRAARAERRILRGDRLRMGFADGETVWWFENPFAEFADAEIRLVMVGPNGAPRLVEAGDCLFGWEGNSQTWISAYADE